jgi:hypothetical protein
MVLVMSASSGDAEVRYRRDNGEFVETTLRRVVADDVLIGLPVREFRWYQGQRHYSGWYWSSTVGRMVAYESRLELARILLADFDPTVTAIAAQPFQLAGRDGSKPRRHVPDLLLRHSDGTLTLVDVKAKSRLADPAVGAQFAWTRQLAHSRGWAFEVWSGAERDLLDNVRFLAGYRREALIERSLLPVALQAVQTGTATTIGGVEDALGGQFPPVLVRPAVLHLLWTGVLRAGLEQPLSSNTVLDVSALATAA